jgi:hypothetical protein
MSYPYRIGAAGAFDLAQHATRTYFSAVGSGAGYL